MEIEVTMKNGVKTLAKLGMIAAFAVWLTSPAQAGATAAITAPAAVVAPAVSAVAGVPAVSATPTSRLVNGTTVQLTATGLTPGETYFTGECSTLATVEYACNSATFRQVVAKSNGTFTAPVVVSSAFTGVAGSGRTHAIDCQAAACAVAVYSPTFDTSTQPMACRQVQVAISFA
jgi:neocarzinostatin family protein